MAMNNFEEQGKERTNINKIVSDTTDKLIKDFSGKDHIAKVKVVDNIIAFVGAAGGTGTSTVVSNVAYSIAKKGLTVLVIDLNIMYPMQHSFFKIKQVVEKKDLISFLLGKNALGESIEISPVDDNISVMFANNRYLVDYINCDNSISSKTMIESVERVRHLFDVIIFDCPRTLEFDVVNTVLYNCNTIYSVWDEGLGCISNIDRMRKNMQTSGIETYSKMKVIFNKKTNVHYVKYVFDELGLNVVETLPFDTSIIESGLRGEVYCDKGSSMSKNAAAFSKDMESLTDKILEIGGYNK